MNRYFVIPLLFILPHVSRSQEAGNGRFHSPRLSVLKNELEHGNRSALERFWTEAKGNAPLVEKFPNDEGLLLVTFLLRAGSEISSVLLQGGPPTPPQKWLTRLADTDLWFRTDPIPQDARFTYGYEVRTNQNTPLEVDAVADALNKRSFDGRSFVELPAAPPQLWIERLPGVPEGKVTLSKSKASALVLIGTSEFIRQQVIHPKANPATSSSFSTGRRTMNLCHSPLFWII